MLQRMERRGLFRVSLGAGVPWAMLALITSGCASAQAKSGRAAAAGPVAPPDSAFAARGDIVSVRTRVSMRRVNFYVDTAVVLHIHHLDGSMRSKKGGPVIFDDKNSFIIT